VSTEKGRDPADFALVAYGGSGPVHAAALATELGAQTAIVPPLAGLFSAAGLLFARPEYHDVRFCRVDAREPDLDALRRLDAEMRDHLGRRVGAETVWRRVADVRYRGQRWSVPIGLPGALTVSRELAEQAVARLGATLGLSTLETARGIHDLANAATMRALRAVSSEKGRDPADVALVAYGGSGPVHAAARAASSVEWPSFAASPATASSARSRDTVSAPEASGPGAM
jgi:N-methylhydantoinase A